jgi:hypothetical protein
LRTGENIIFLIDVLLPRISRGVTTVRQQQRRRKRDEDRIERSQSHPLQRHGRASSRGWSTAFALPAQRVA